MSHRCHKRYGGMLICLQTLIATSHRLCGVTHAWQKDAARLQHSGRRCYRATTLRCARPDGADGERDGGDQSSLSDHTRLARLYVGPRDVWLGNSTPSRTNRRLPPASQLRPQVQVPFTPDQSHYVTNVLRLFTKRRSSGPLVRVFDGSSGEWLAQVEAPPLPDDAVRRRRGAASAPVLARCLERLRPQPARIDSPSIWAAPPKKRERLRWLVEKATELNVQEFLWLDTDYSETGSFGLDKLEVYAIEAAEQCERLDIPRLVQFETEETAASDPGGDTCPFEKAVEAWALDPAHRQSTKLLFCRERGEDSLSVLETLERVSRPCDNVEETARKPQITFVVGPEGGWSARENAIMDDLVARFPNDAFVASLGSNVLRAETAAVTAIAAHLLFTDCNT